MVHLNGNRSSVEVDDEVVALNDGLGVTPGAAHDGVDARHQLVLVEWLGGAVAATSSPLSIIHAIVCHSA